MRQGPDEKTLLEDVPWPDEPPVMLPGQTYDTVTDTIADAVLKRPIGMGWLGGFFIAGMCVMVLLIAVTYLFFRGVGIFGIMIPVAWGFCIINFVWWIGIGHAGTLISAILLLLKQTWRNSINRFAEAMTLFAVACAGMFPIASPGPPLAVLLAVPVPRHHGRVAAVPQPAGVGRVRGFDLRHHLGGVLVCRPGAGFRHHARASAASARLGRSTDCSRWAGAVRRGTGNATSRYTCY